MTRADHTFRTTAGHPAAGDVPGGQSGGHPISFLEFDGQAQSQSLAHACDQRLARPLADRLVIQREDLFHRTGRDRRGNRLDPDSIPVGGRVPGLHCALLDEDQGRQDVPADAAGGAVTAQLRREQGKLGHCARDFHAKPLRRIARLEDLRPDRLQVLAPAAPAPCWPARPGPRHRMRPAPRGAASGENPGHPFGQPPWSQRRHLGAGGDAPLGHLAIVRGVGLRVESGQAQHPHSGLAQPLDRPGQ